MKRLLVAFTAIALILGGASAPAYAAPEKPSKTKKVYVDDNATYSGPQTLGATPSWALDRIDSHALSYDSQYTHFWGYPNNVVKAYVIDSGVRSTHAQLAGKVLPGWDFVDNDNVAQDCYGHGTHVAGLIAGTNYGSAGDTPVKIVPLRVFDCVGVGTQAGVAAALDWVLANGTKPGVVNMSLSFSAIDPLIDGKVQALINAGFHVVVAAGNQNVDACTKSPGHVAGVITVGNSQSTDAKQNSSNWGTCVDLFAPGSYVNSSCYDSDTSICSKNGTSMSSPIVAGVAALYLKLNPLATPAQFQNWLLTSVSPSGHTDNVLTGLPAGTPNKLVYAGS
jgi:subtilisin family serine protease